MNWDAIGAVGEIIGAMAVVASLAYLALQIRHNTREVEEQNRAHELGTLSDIAGRFTSWRSRIIENPEVAALWQRGRDELGVLESDERFRFDHLAEEFYWSFAMLWLYHGIGGVDEASLELTINNINRAANTPGLKQWWQESDSKLDYPEEFVDHITQMYQDS